MRYVAGRGRALKSPMLFTVTFSPHPGKIISLMLGVAFNSVQQQAIYDRFKVINYWHYNVKLDREKLYEVRAR